MCQKSIIRQLHHTIKRIGDKKKKKSTTITALHTIVAVATAPHSQCTLYTKWLQATLIDKSDLPICVQSFLFYITQIFSSPFFFVAVGLLHTLQFRERARKKNISRRNKSNPMHWTKMSKQKRFWHTFSNNIASRIGQWPPRCDHLHTKCIQFQSAPMRTGKQRNQKKRKERDWW